MAQSPVNTPLDDDDDDDDDNELTMLKMTTMRRAMTVLTMKNAIRTMRTMKMTVTMITIIDGDCSVSNDAVYRWPFVGNCYFRLKKSCFLYIFSFDAIQSEDHNEQANSIIKWVLTFMTSLYGILQMSNFESVSNMIATNDRQWIIISNQ